MLHDVLLALLGFTGDIIETDVDTGSLGIVPAVSKKLERFDTEIINDLLKVGSLYVFLRTWSDRQISDPNSNLYDLVLAHTLADTILANYEKTVSDIEERVLDMSGSGPTGGMNLSAIRLEIFDKWNENFASIKVDVIERGNKEEVSIIDHVISHNAQRKSEVLQQLQNRLLQSFVRELVSWCKYGVVAGGPCSEFFVRRIVVENQLVKAVDEIAQFQIDRSRLPSRLVSSDVANKILFCGRAVVVLKNGERSAIVTRDCDALTPKSPSGDVFGLAEYIATEIEKLRLYLAKRLSNRMKLEMTPGLMDHLARLRGIYLLGYGDQWIKFSQGTPDTPRQKDLFASVFNEPEEDTVRLAEDGIHIEYDLPWPLELVVSPAALDKYNSVAELLQLVLRATCRFRRVCNLKLSAFLASLCAYLQIDVIESAFSEFIKKAAESDDIQEIANEHDIFLTRVTAGCLVGVDQVWNKVEAIIKLGEEFSRQQGDVKRIDAKLTTEIDSLLSELEALQLRPTYNSINRLFLKLDFNRFYRPDDKFRGR